MPPEPRFFAIVVLFLATSLHAQGKAAYARTRGDTLRLREQTSARSTLTLRTGKIVITSDHDAILAVTFAKNDTAKAWYEALSLTEGTSAGRKSPNTAGALRKPFSMRFNERGKIDNVTPPKFPANIDSISDLRKQFDDFFMPLPQKALVRGLTWVDSSDAVDNNTKNGSWQRSRRIGHYKVERDTTIAGKRAFVVSAVQALHVESGAPLPGGVENGFSQNVLTGGDTGIVVFDPIAGRMLGRKRQGSMSGILTMRPAEGLPSIVTEEMKYVNVISTAKK